MCRLLMRFGSHLGERAGKEVGLLLVVALERYPVTLADDVVQQVLEPTRLDHLSLTVCAASLQALRFRGSARVPTAGRSALCRRHDRRVQPINARAVAWSIAVGSAPIPLRAVRLLTRNPPPRAAPPPILPPQ